MAVTKALREGGGRSQTIVGLSIVVEEMIKCREGRRSSRGIQRQEVQRYRNGRGWRIPGASAAEMDCLGQSGSGDGSGTFVVKNLNQKLTYACGVIVR